MAVALDLRALGERVAERFARGSAHQRLPAAGERHDAAASGLARPSTSIGFAPRAMSSAVFSRRVTAPDMDADPGAKREIGECLVIGERVAGRVCHFVEQQEEAVGAIDLAP